MVLSFSAKRRGRVLGFMTGVLLALSGCVSLPPPAPIVHQPMSARAAPPPAPPGNGSVYQDVDQYHSLFIDRRARQIGDTLVILLTERTNASKRSNSSANKNGDLSFGIPPIVFGVPITKKIDLGASSSNDFAGKGEAASANNFSGTITVTVIDLLPNGYLVVSGEKQLAMTQGSEYIRFSGVVRPQTVINNTVSSIQVADARIEYKANGYIDEAQTMGWLSRFFLTVAPF
ncbi:flagellar basal body L-ring protein FlgH [Nitrosospira multiformis]|uniref:Flagellar L-ring protein n=1 Tax=Nitrosospira multiformis TaxID=1231 RepID=A0A1I7IIQ5_9PROT|nr:flagellar basal body L-ring protein FlgH [Nitrosospira multiformis]SFU72817.1 flagellar L-ring protein precursor FlgH [Nitrosospira multiformis]